MIFVCRDSSFANSAECDDAGHPGPRSGFTLIEIMIAVAIIGVVVGIGVPSMFRMMKKEGMRAAASDLLEVCHRARAAAILSGSTVQLQILPKTGEFKVVSGGSSAPEPAPSADNPLAPQPPDGAPPAKVASPTPEFSIQLAGDIAIVLVDVNFLDVTEADDVRVRFFPGGTSDEMTVVVHSAGNEWRKISLEVTTALAQMESDPLKFATK